MAWHGPEQMARHIRRTERLDTVANELEIELELELELETMRLWKCCYKMKTLQREAVGCWVAH